MSEFNKNSDDDKPKTPAWIVSYSDMVTLLLAFFVLLQAFAENQDPELFRVGQGAFRRAIAGFGIPNWLFGRPESIGRDRKPKYTTEESEKPTKKRVLDARDEKIRQLFDDLKRAADTKTDNRWNNQATIINTPISFSRLQISPDVEAKRFLDGVCNNIRYGVESENITVYVVARAPDQPSGRKQWLTAARRAWEIEQYMRDKLRTRQGYNSMRIVSWAEPCTPKRVGGSEDVEFVRIAIDTEK